MAKKKGRTDAQTTRNMQTNTNRRMVNALQQSGWASGGVREGMEYGRFPGTAGDRIQTEREEARDAARARSPETQAQRTENQALTEDRAKRRAAGGKMEAKKMATRPTERPSRAPAASQKPTPRPSTADERAAGERGDRAARRDAGMKAGGKVKKMAMGGKCRGMGAATKGGNYSRG
jgi:hypothetical protein